MNTRISLLRPEGRDLERCAGAFVWIAWGVGIAFVIAELLPWIYRALTAWMLPPLTGDMFQWMFLLNALILGGFSFAGYLLQWNGLRILSPWIPRGRLLQGLVIGMLLLVWVEHALMLTGFARASWMAWVILQCLGAAFAVLLGTMSWRFAEAAGTDRLKRHVPWCTALFAAGMLAYGSLGFLEGVLPVGVAVAIFIFHLAAALCFALLLALMARGCRRVALTHEPSPSGERPT